MDHWHEYSTRYLGDANPNRKRHIHDLTNEKKSCALHAVEWAHNAVPFPTREAAYAAGYVPCVFCMPYEKGAS
ncbi:MAG: hypothetical protein HZB55_02160 [Deltaproteobacteria bacterium]|nr:hypothetical protein [Deltaproteobacteria bacterium]